MGEGRKGIGRLRGVRRDPHPAHDRTGSGVKVRYWSAFGQERKFVASGFQSQLAPQPGQIWALGGSRFDSLEV